MTKLFSPLTIRNIEFRNRIFLSPMCQYSCIDGKPSDWHLVHLGSRAAGGVALVLVEATAVSPGGRISPHDSGMWSQEHARAYQRVVTFIEEQGAIPGIQLAHAGRKASTRAPWEGGGPLPSDESPWQTLAPSPIPFAANYPSPREMDKKDITLLIEQFEKATQFSLWAGFKVVEVHMAHGYLVHQFLSPLTNQRRDEYGGSFENRTRLPLQIARTVRETWPADLPVFVRISGTDWSESGWDPEQAVRFCRHLQEIGIDLIDCSSGGILPGIRIPVTPGYQVPFAAEIREKVNIKTGAVGLITEPRQAEEIIATGQADAVLLGRELLRNPYWPLTAAQQLGVDIPWPLQYERAKT